MPDLTPKIKYIDDFEKAVIEVFYDGNTRVYLMERDSDLYFEIPAREFISCLKTFIKIYKPEQDSQ